MIRISTLFFFLYLTAALAAQQEGIQIKNDLGVEALVRDIFIKGNCRNVSNINALGNEELSFGQFSNAADILGMTEGIILSTGSTELADGPNLNGDVSFAFDVPSDDSDLRELATGDLFDVTGIEFDFVPFGDNVTFRYAFASEEYCEFVGTTFNDVFGFFVSGPGINGPFDNNAINVASVPGTNIDVSINTINHIDNTAFYINNVINVDANACQLNIGTQFEDLIEYDGFTVPLIASIQVIPCETYHIRLVLGDVGDPNLDSAVFLESNSFDLGEKVNVRAEVPGRDDLIAFENCIDAQYVFTRSASTSLNEACTIEYTISPDSEAINGVDFEQIPLSVTIPAGESTFTLPITIIDDNIIEGPENLKLEFQYECDCLDPVLSEITINEPTEISASIKPIIVCIDQPFSVSSEISGGVPPYEFVWNTGATSESIDETITTPTQFSVAVTDFCGSSDMAAVNVGTQEVPTASLIGNFNLCETISTGIPVQFEGNPPWTIAYSIDGIDQVPIENIQTNPFFIDTQVEGIYALTLFNDATCEGNVVNSAIVEFSTFDITTEITSPSCFNRADGSIALTQLDAIAPFSIEWNVPTEDNLLLDSLLAGTYRLTILDGNGCQFERIFELEAISDDLDQCSPFFIPNSFSPNGDDINDFFSIFYDQNSGIEQITFMQIFDRWGNLVFEQRNFVSDNGLTIGWNGEFDGSALDPGVFVFHILIAFEDGRTKLETGDVTLVK